MDEKPVCTCGTGRYCHQHKAYNLPPAKAATEMRRVALLGVTGKGRPVIKNTTEVG